MNKREKDNLGHKQLYELRKANKECVKCGSKDLVTKTKCEKHANQNTKSRKKLYEKRDAEGLCRFCGNLKNTLTQRCNDCLKKSNNLNKKRMQLIRHKCIESYGGQCICCGQKNHKYLQLDHVDNDGAEHRNILKNQGIANITVWAYYNNYPNNLQLLCANCHAAKSYHGGCNKGIDHI